MTTSVRLKSAAAMLSLARIGYSQWFFGNLYEAIVRVPDLLAEGGHLISVLGAGSPVRYYAPGFLLSFGATLAAVVLVWKSPRERLELLTIALALLAGALATVYLVGTVNLNLFMNGTSIPPAERSRMLSIWYHVNTIRLGTTACAWLLAARFGSRLHSKDRS